MSHVDLKLLTDREDGASKAAAVDELAVDEAGHGKLQAAVSGILLLPLPYSVTPVGLSKTVH